MKNLLHFNYKKTSLLLFAILTISVVILQSVFFSDQLKYGFRDGDWMILHRFKTLGELSFNHFIEAWRVQGIYTYQIYYIGFAEQFVGLDFRALHQISQTFRILATLGIFPLVYLITKNKLTAFLTTVIYTISYTSAGALYMHLTGGYYIAIIFMLVFFILYWNLVDKNILRKKWLTLLSVLLILILLLNTERMYPLLALIVVIELFYIWIKKFQKSALKTALIRLISLLGPIVLFYLIYSLFFKQAVTEAYFTPNFIRQIGVRVNSILAGNWQLILYPFASVGSMFLPLEYGKYLGRVDVINFMNYLTYFIKGPFLTFSIISLFIALIAIKKRTRFLLISLIPLVSFGLISFLIYKNWENFHSSLRIHFDPSLILPFDFVGVYVLSLAFGFFWEWKQNKNNNFLIPLFVGPYFAFLIILLTWLPSDVSLLFMGPQRYFTIPAIGQSLFLAGLISLLFYQLRKTRLKKFSWVVLLILIPIIFANGQAIRQFFKYEINFAGMGGDDQTVMKNKFWSIVGPISDTEPSLFYFDETLAKDDGYFDESTVMAGIEHWTLFEGSNVVETRPSPGIVRTNVSCEKNTHESCMDYLKKNLISKDGIQGILHRGTFYKLDDFYAIKFIGKEMIDIREEVVDQLR